MSVKNNRIFLIGYMGSGKTTVSAVLSEMTGYRLVDMDAEIEQAEQMSIRTMFIKYGEHEFRNKEAELLDKLCQVSSAVQLLSGEEEPELAEASGDSAGAKKPGKYDAFAQLKEDIIVSCGGGVILDDLNRLILQKQNTVFLEGTPKLLFDRVNGDTGRPFAFMDVNNEEERLQKFLDLYEKREPLYQESAAITVTIEGKTPEEIAQEILDQLGSRERA